MNKARPIGIVLHRIGDQTLAKSELVQFRLVIGKYERGKPFVTSPIIQQTIGDLHIQEGTLIGNATIKLDHAQKRAITTWYYPTTFERRLRGIGIPDLLDTQLHKFVGKQLPHYRVIEDEAIEVSRLEQLRKQGRHHEIPTPVMKAYKLAKRRAIEQYHKHKYLIRRKRP